MLRVSPYPGPPVGVCGALEVEDAVTETEWLACTDPVGLLGFERLQPTERKLRLFAAACCRRMLAAVPVRCLDAAVATAEGFADGRAAAEELDAACRTADGIGDGAGNTA
jgi:hypothetical protein